MADLILPVWAAVVLSAPVHAWRGPAEPPQPAVGNWSAAPSAVSPIPLDKVRVRGFLGEHVDANSRRSLPAGLDCPIPKGIEAVSRGEEPPAVCRRLATDSDFFKWFEGACYAIAYDTSATADLRPAVDRYAKMLVELQDETGYLGTRISPSKPFDERVAHDLYCAGHFFEAAVAHHRATGERALLDAAVRLADFYIRAHDEGHPYFKIVGRREHPEIELALVRLYRATGQRRFLEFAATIARMSKVGPTIDQVEAGGGRTHAVRFCYLLTGRAELYMETGDESWRQHLEPLWDEVVSKRMYVTGGIGYNERIPVEPYDLPQSLSDNPNRDIAETCASVAMMMYSWRLHAIMGQNRYFDTIENILYNHYLGAISNDHLGNFYYNPLRRVGDLSGKTDHGGDPTQRTRLPAIHSTACCLPNAWRFFGQLPEYIFSARDELILVNLYTEASGNHRLPDGSDVALEVETRYPHEGRVAIRVASIGNTSQAARFCLGLRIPAWCDAASTSVNDETRKAAPGTYHRIDRTWKAGDVVILDMPMRPVALLSRPEIEANRGQVAFRRGPIVYCLEKQDAGIPLERAVVALDPATPSASVRAEWSEALGFHVLRVRVGERRDVPADPPPYFELPPLLPTDLRTVQLVPFYARANRDPDTRWITFIPFQPFAARP